jgi:septal ring factor EnvC (AmiA/AmiB activator)
MKLTCFKRTWGATLITLLLSSSVVLGKNTSIDDEDPKQVKKALSGVQDQIKKLEKNVFQSQRQEKLLVKQLADLEKEIGDRSEYSRDLQDKLNQHNLSLKDLSQEEEAFRQKNKAQQAMLSELVQGTYRHYQKEKMQLLLEQKEWSTLARLNHYYQYFYDARAQQISDLQAHLKETQVLHQKIQHEKQRVEDLALKLKAEDIELQQKKDQRAKVLENLSKQLANDADKLAHLQQQEQYLEQIFKTLQQKLNTTPTYIEPAQDFAKMKKLLAMPIQEPGIQLSVMPNLKKTNSKKTYIGAPAGTAVHAIFTGRVVFADWLRGVGLLLIVDHGNGYMSLYGNNQKLYKGLGDWVTQGEMIARVGQSGGHAEPGLYFEIRKDGEALDPTSWLKHA